MTEYLQVTVACANAEEARRISRALVEARLAACVQVVGPIRSTYWWQGRVEEAEEWLCVAKTNRERYPALEETVLRLHSYQVPEVIAVPVAASSPTYLDWLGQELSDRTQP